LLAKSGPSPRGLCLDGYQLHSSHFLTVSWSWLAALAATPRPLILGLVADSVLQLGGRVVGVIPEAQAQKELAHKNLIELHVTASMHARKTLMAELSDGFIALPGGIGTLEEIFEIWTWAQLGFHAKPCGVLNVAGYYDGLIAFLDHAVDEQFVKPLHRSILCVEQEPNALLDSFARYQAPSIAKWVDKDQT
jgi:uncharacterized protein (TIGR00730 family)